MAQPNPYEPPRAPDVAPAQEGVWAACPECGQRAAKLLGFTWWGGWVGAKYLNHVECTACGQRYNGKTGGSNTVAIVLYQIVIGVLVLVILAMVRLLRT